MDWASYSNQVAERCRDTADGSTVVAGSLASCDQAAIDSGGTYEWVADEQACVEQYPSHDWQECMVWELENDNCEPWCHSPDT